MEQDIVSPKKVSKIGILVPIVLVLVIISGIVFVLRSKTEKKISVSKPEPTPKIEITIEETITPTPILENLPQENTIYFGKYQGKDALFVTNPSKQRYYENGKPKTNSYYGEFITDNNGGFTKEFKELVGAKPLYKSVEEIQQINKFIVGKSGKYIYASINMPKPTSVYMHKAENLILRFGISGIDIKQIWSVELGSPKYSKGKGYAYLRNESDDKFLEFDVLGCYACEPYYGGSVILNINTGKEIYLPEASGININLATSSYSYKKFTHEPCEPGFACPEGQTEIIKPTSQTYTKKLP